MDTEKEFLKNYSTDKYEKPSVTADVVAFKISKTELSGSYRHEPEYQLSILLVKRGGHPFKGCWALAGGFLEKGETIEECAVREIQEETNITPASVRFVGMFTEPNRDPRGWIISAGFVSVMREGSMTEAVGGDDATDAKWFDISLDETENGRYSLHLRNGDIALNAVLQLETTATGIHRFVILENDGLAFDHASMIATALTVLRKEGIHFESCFDFLPEEFTLTQLQRVQEILLNTPMISANFRRKALHYVVETGNRTSGAGHRPAKLYRKK